VFVVETQPELFEFIAYPVGQELQTIELLCREQERQFVGQEVQVCVELL
jgi:hypothetical protein